MSTGTVLAKQNRIEIGLTLTPAHHHSHHHHRFNAFPLPLPPLFRYMKRPRMTHVGIYDPGSIYNQSQSFAQTNLQFWRIESTVKLVFYLVCFFYYLYSMMYTILA